MLVPIGNLIPDIFDNRKDLPLFEFPITPILTTFPFLNSSYFYKALWLILTPHPLVISLIEFIQTITS